MSALGTLAKGGIEYLLMLQATLQLDQRLLDEITNKREHVDLWKKFPALTGKVKNIWDLELWVIDEHGVTVKKLAMAYLQLEDTEKAKQVLKTVVKNKTYKAEEAKQLLDAL